jgi:hypothetical protein
MDPFKAILSPSAECGEDSSDDEDDDDDDSFCSLSDEPNVNDLFGKYRLMYTSFVRCQRYLSRIQEHKQNGRPPSVISYQSAGFPQFGASKNLKKFLARSGGLVSSKGPVISNPSQDISHIPAGVADTDESSVSDYSEQPRPSQSAQLPFVRSGESDEGDDEAEPDRKVSNTLFLTALI